MMLTKKLLSALVEVAEISPESALRQAFNVGAQCGQSEEMLNAIKRAAEMLDCDAEELKAAHTIAGNWSGEDEAKADYDERKKVAKVLRGLA